LIFVDIFIHLGSLRSNLLISKANSRYLSFSHSTCSYRLDELSISDFSRLYPVDKTQAANLLSRLITFDSLPRVR